ncbi:unnamed protein product [Closterium sp. NIES-54]
MDRGPERRRPVWAATFAYEEAEERGREDTRQCHNCGQPGHLRRDCQNPAACSLCGSQGHLRRDCPSAPICVHCGQRGHREADCYASRRDQRGGEGGEDRQATMARLRAQLAELEAAEEKQPAMVAQEEEGADEPEFMLMVQPARNREELGLRSGARRQLFREDVRREECPRRQASKTGRAEGAAYRHPRERMICQATVLTIKPGAITIGGLRA